MSVKLRVLETNLLHADGALVWLDATSGDPDAPATLTTVRAPLAVTLTTHPADLRWRAKPGRLVVWRRPAGPMVAGEADAAARARPALAPYRIAGTAADPSGRFNPLAFDLDVTGAGGEPVLLFPSPLGTATGSTGGVLEGTVRFAATGDPALDGQPARWARLRLDVTLVPADADTPALVRGFVAQADAHGDFRLLLHRVPPLPDGVDEYTASLAITAPVGAGVAAAPANGYAPMQIAGGAAPLAFAATRAVTLIPGERARLASADLDHLAVTPA
jgi:hypothetical protein